LICPFTATSINFVGQLLALRKHMRIERLYRVEELWLRRSVLAISEANVYLHCSYLSRRFPEVADTDLEFEPHMRPVWKHPLIQKQPRSLAAYQSFGVKESSFGILFGSSGLPLDNSQRSESSEDTDKGCNDQRPTGNSFWPESPMQIALCIVAGMVFLFGGCEIAYKRDGFWWGLLSCFLLLCGLGLLNLTRIAAHINSKHDTDDSCSHSGVIVPHKYFLTSTNYWGTVSDIGRTDMPNVLSTDKQVAVISALAEGSGIRQIERITGVHRDTIMRLGVRVGKGCANVLDRKMRNLSCNHLQFDEVWGFIGKKERHCTPDDSPEVGDVWTFCAIDSDTKIVPSFKVGKRDAVTANAFVADVASRLKNRVQISSDALRAYVDAIELAFGANVDFAQIVKTYVHEDAQNAERKYSAPEFVIEEKKAVAGFPDMRLASTSHIERLNGTTRLHMRRLTRLTYAFSKKRENFEAAVALHFAYYNFVKRHNTLRCTPAMAAGIERDFWSVRDLVEAAA